VPERWRVRPRDAVDLGAVDTDSTAGVPGKVAAGEALGALREELSALQERLWAEGRRSLLVVLQAMDTGGKDGTIRHVFRGVNPQGVRVTSFKEPTAAEAAHDFLWRVHQAAPAAGEIGVFNRSHYEDVVVVRVHGLVSQDMCEERYGLITGFEELLGHGGTTVVKFFLHISPEEQLRRLQRRQERPDKRWKYKASDLAERAHWDDYMTAYADAIARTSTETSPWYVIPADRKWYRNWAVAQVLVDTLRNMDPQYPTETG
jgi:PPK2 family polyphosphate:nucleotide phosphotransferase